MHSLEVAFKKYSVTHIECQMYVACEAGQENRQEENGPLAKIVFDIIRYTYKYNSRVLQPLVVYA